MNSNALSAMQESELSILLVEPSPMQLKVIIRHLQQAGINRVDGVHTGRQALQLASQYPPDLVISAMYLPDMTADQLLEQLRAQPQCNNSHFMLISSERRAAALESLRQSGVVAILPKPFDHADLRRALRATLDYIDPAEIELQNYDVSSLKLLVVDDSLTARNHISRVFNALGIDSIDTADNGKAALALLQQYDYDLLVTDLNMPELDGQQLVRELRNQPGNDLLPVLVVTSEQDQARLGQVEQAGVAAILDKPFEPQTLREILFRVLDQP